MGRRRVRSGVEWGLFRAAARPVAAAHTEPTEPAQSQYGGRLRVAGFPVDDRDNNRLITLTRSHLAYPRPRSRRPRSRRGRARRAPGPRGPRQAHLHHARRPRLLLHVLGALEGGRPRRPLDGEQVAQGRVQPAARFLASCCGA